jgi:dihydrofolate synthase/folylpolyglutamate synthase
VNLDKSLEKLYQRRQFGIKPGLAPVKRMCELLENPQDSYGVIHVAGTNGKGSVCTMISAILQEAGIKTGLYTSPHLVRFNERIRINGIPLDDREIASVLDLCEEAAETVKKEQGHEVTFFEITTVLAFECFRRAGVKIAVIETGLGGRLDATNVVNPLVSVITAISQDHTAHLGNGLPEIAAEKAGIIKPHRPLVIAPQPYEAAEQVLCEKAAAMKSPLTMAAEAVSINRLSGDLHGQKLHFETTDGLSGTTLLPLLGDHQLENLGSAIAAVEILFSMLRVPLDPTAIKNGIKKVSWPGRCQLLQESPVIIADAAHNPAGAKALVRVLKRNKIKQAGFVLGMCGDKDTAGVIKHLAEAARRIWVVPIADERSIAPEKLANKIAACGIEVESIATLKQALKEAKAWASKENLPIVITGSIFLLGELDPEGLSPAPPIKEVAGS